jgi:hypothetical protein
MNRAEFLEAKQDGRLCPAYSMCRYTVFSKPACATIFRLGLITEDKFSYILVYDNNDPNHFDNFVSSSFRQFDRFEDAFLEMLRFTGLDTPAESQIKQTIERMRAKHD